MCGKGIGICKPRARTDRRRPFDLTELKRRTESWAMRNIDDLKTLSFWRGVLAEFTATFFLVLVGCGASIDTGNNPLEIRIAFAFGFMYAVLIYSLRHVSGGHLNPAVSVAMAVTCKISLARAILYVVAQTIGAILGAAVLYGVTPDLQRGTLGCTIPRADVTEGQGFGVEFFSTLILVFVTFACFEEHDQKEERRCPGHLVIGLTVAALLLFANPLTGGSFNAARSFGPAVVRGLWTNHWIYWFGTIFGGVLGGVIYDIVFAKSATLKQMISCMAGVGRADKKKPSIVSSPEGPASDAERQALRSGVDKATGDSIEEEDSGDEAAKAKQTIC